MENGVKKSWSPEQRRKFKATMKKKKAAKGRAREVVHVPAQAIEAIAGRSGFEVKRAGASHELTLDVKVGSEMTLSLGGVTLRLRAVQ